jgi:hypothetical protein
MSRPFRLCGICAGRSMAGVELAMNSRNRTSPVAPDSAAPPHRVTGGRSIRQRQVAVLLDEAADLGLKPAELGGGVGHGVRQPLSVSAPRVLHIPTGPAGVLRDP